MRLLHRQVRQLGEEGHGDRDFLLEVLGAGPRCVGQHDQVGQQNQLPAQGEVRERRGCHQGVHLRSGLRLHHCRLDLGGGRPLSRHLARLRGRLYEP